MRRIIGMRTKGKIEEKGRTLKRPFNLCELLESGGTTHTREREGRNPILHLKNNNI